MWSKAAISLGIKVLLEKAGMGTFLRPGEGESLSEQFRCTRSV